MRTLRFEFTTVVNASADDLWKFHVEEGALEQLSPWWSGFRVVDPGRGVADDSLVVAEIGRGPIALRWEALHSGVRPGHGFVDIALHSPFRYWVHHHEFEALDPGRSRLRDVIWLVPPRWLPDAIAKPVLKTVLGILFSWRHRTTRAAVEAATTTDRSTEQRPETPVTAWCTR